MNNLSIRLGTLKDWQTIQKIGLQTFVDSFKDKNTLENFNSYINKAFSENKIRQELQDSNSFFYLFFLKKELIGYLKLNIGDAQTEDQGPYSLEIERIYIYKHHQRKGHGKILFDYAVQKALEQKKSRVWLGVWEENKDAIKFYKRLGFSEFDRHTFMMGDEAQTDLMLQLMIHHEPRL